MRAAIPAVFVILAASGCQGQIESRSISSEAMAPTLVPGDRLIVVNSKAFKRLDLITFNSPHAFDPVLREGHSTSSCWLTNIAILGKYLSKRINNPACDVFIKRVIALPGEQVEVDATGRVAINNQPLKETYVESYCPVDRQGLGLCRTLSTVVPPGHVLTLGDNRANSFDGRFWPGGAFLPIKEIRGVAASIYFPSNRVKEF